MPPFVHTRSVEHYYAGSKDARDQHLGIVQPGDVREFDELFQPPDNWWEPATDELVARMKAIRDAQAALEAGPADEGGGGDDSGQDGTGDEGSGSAGTPPAPAAALTPGTPPGTPAPPAAPPASPATQTDEAGVTGSEES